jgi:hypothetical protein
VSVTQRCSGASARQCRAQTSRISPVWTRSSAGSSRWTSNAFVDQKPLDRAGAWEPQGRPFERRPAQPVAGGLQPRRNAGQLGAAGGVGDRPPEPAQLRRVEAVVASADADDLGSQPAKKPDTARRRSSSQNQKSMWSCRGGDRW